MAIQWAPDFSAFTLDPNARWMTTGDPWEQSSMRTGWHTQSAGDPFEGGAGSGWQFVNEPADNSLRALQGAGAWNLSDPSLQRFLASRGGADWMSNPTSTAALLARLGVNTKQNLPEIQAAFGKTFTPEYLQQVEATRAAQQRAGTNSGGLGGIVDAGVDLAKGYAPFALGALGAYGATTGLGALLGEGGAAGGAGAAGAEGAAASGGATAAAPVYTGTGITPGAAGATGITPGAAGATGISAIPPANTSFAPGFFASEGLGATGALGAAGAGASGGPTGGATGAAGSNLAPTTALPSLTQIAAGALPAALGAIGSKSQADAYSGLANQYMAMGAPYRSRLSELYSDPEGYLNSAEVLIPVQNATNVLARSLSTKGNPIGSGNALQQLQNYASEQLFSRLGQEKDRLAGFGGLTQYAAAAPQAAMSGINAQRGIYDAIGAGAADIFNPPRRISLEDLLRY